MDKKTQPILWAEQSIGALVSSLWPFVKIHKTSQVNSRIGQKWGVDVLLTIYSIHSMSSILTKFEQQEYKNKMKKKQKNKEMSNLEL